MDIFATLDRPFVERVGEAIDRASFVCLDGNLSVDALRVAAQRARDAGVRGKVEAKWREEEKRIACI